MVSFYNIFCEMYIENTRQKHANDKDWATKRQIVENLGGREAINSVYRLWIQLSYDKQVETLGFNSEDVMTKVRKINTSLRRRRADK